jgi:hypothetical protein
MRVKSAQAVEVTGRRQASRTRCARRRGTCRCSRPAGGWWSRSMRGLAGRRQGSERAEVVGAGRRMLRRGSIRISSGHAGGPRVRDVRRAASRSARRAVRVGCGLGPLVRGSRRRSAARVVPESGAATELMQPGASMSRARGGCLPPALHVSRAGQEAFGNGAGLRCPRRRAQRLLVELDHDSATFGEDGCTVGGEKTEDRRCTPHRTYPCARARNERPRHLARGSGRGN